MITWTILTFLINLWLHYNFIFILFINYFLTLAFILIIGIENLILCHCKVDTIRNILIIIRIIKFVKNWISSGYNYLIFLELLQILIKSIKSLAMRYCHIHPILIIFLLILIQVIIVYMQKLIFCILLLLRSIISIIYSALTIYYIHYVWYILLLLLRQLTLMSSMIIIRTSNWCPNHRICNSYTNYLILIWLLFGLINLHW